jgi:CheY-like chemotaxis protein
VTVANDGREAVEHYLETTFDLILMDMQMPEMDGLQATVAIRGLEQGTRVPIIAMTANAMLEDRKRCFEVGMDGFLTKPIAVETLRKTLAGVGGAASTESAVTVQKTSPADGEAPFDLATALAQVGDNHDLLTQLGDILLEEWPLRRASLREAAKADQQAEVAAMAHRCKGSFGAIAAGPAHRLAARVEQAGKAGQATVELVGSLIEAGDLCCEALAAWRRNGVETA